MQNRRLCPAGDSGGELLIGRVPARHIQLCGIGRTAFLFQNKGCVRTPRQSRRARHFVEHVAVVLLSDVVYDNDRQRVPVGKVFDKGDVPAASRTGCSA